MTDSIRRAIKSAAYNYLKGIYDRNKFFYLSASKKRGKTAYPAVGGAASLNTLFHLPPSPPLIHYPAIGVPNGPYIVHFRRE